MHHIHIIHSQSDRLAAAVLNSRLQRHYRNNSYDVCVSIHKALEQLSADPQDRNYLIVLCSPNMADHPGIREQILRFCQTEPVSHIIPYVVRGQPNAKEPKQECLPGILMELSGNDVLAVNPLELGRQTALHRIISTIHETPIDVLERRREKQVLRYRRMVVLLTALFLLLTAWSEYRHDTHTEYYRAYTYAYGVPMGIDRLGPLERLLVRDYYIFRVNYKDPLSVERVGDPPGVDSEDPAVRSFYDAIDTPGVVFSYHTDGTLDGVAHTDENDQILFVIHYLADGAAADLSRWADGVDPYFLTLDGKKTPYTRCFFEYDTEGQLVAIRYATGSRDDWDEWEGS